jgi:hypothetical protein
MSTNGYLGCAGLALLASWPLTASAQNTAVKPSKDLLEAIALDVPIDPATRVDPAAMPRDIGSRALDSLGLTAEQLATPRALTYSATHLEDASGALGVFYASVVKHRDRWVFWSEDLPKATVRASPEVQLTFETARNTRYLVDFALDSAAQEFAVVVGETRTTLTPERGHIALIVSGAGNEQKVRLVPLGDASFKSRRFTLFQVTVTPIS